MEPKVPVLLLVLVETARLRWFVASVGLDGQAVPLLRSEVGDLEKYKGLSPDEQLSFLRHRFCGVLQRGCDRIWARNSKAIHFAIVFEGLLPEPTGQLTQLVAAHFTQWMLNPPVVVFNSPQEIGPNYTGPLEKLAGKLDGSLEDLLVQQLRELMVLRENPEAWELSRTKGT